MRRSWSEHDALCGRSFVAPRVLSGPAGVQFEFILKFSFWVRENLSGYGVVGGMRGQWRACYGS